MVGHFRPFNSRFRRSVAATTTISYKAAEERTNIPFGSGKADRNVCGPTVYPAVSSSTIFVSAGHENVLINIEMSEIPSGCRWNDVSITVFAKKTPVTTNRRLINTKCYIDNPYVFMDTLTLSSKQITRQLKQHMFAVTQKNQNS